MEDREDSMIRLCEISKNYGENRVLDRVTFTVDRGETVVLTGESGCGKTTLLRIIAGVESYNSGRLYLDGQEVTDDLAPHRRNIAMVFQEATLWNHLSVYGNITYGMKKKDRQLVQKIASGLKIQELLDRYPAEISGGQAKRVSLARAFASDRDILLLDEPLSNLDNETRESVLDMILETYASKKTILYVTHDRMEAGRLGCPEYRMENGKLLRRG